MGSEQNAGVSVVPAATAILVAEDEAIISLMLQDELEAQGYVCTVAGTVAEAREAVRTRCFAVAILDVNLGGEQIFPVAQELADLGVPYIFATGYDHSSLPAEFANTPVLEKPFNSEALVAKIVHAIQPGAEPRGRECTACVSPKKTAYTTVQF